MTNEIKNYLIEFNKAHKWGVTDSDLIETLQESKHVDKEHAYGTRWWECWFNVAQIGDKFIRYTWAEANRDESIFDLGWEFDWDSVVEVFPKEVTKVIYTPKKN